MSKRRFPWKRGERKDPELALLKGDLKQIEKLSAHVLEYFKDGAYAPLGGMLQYIRKDVNRALRRVRTVVWKYMR